MTETLAAPLKRAAQLFGDQEAVVDGDLRWSYSELHARVGAFDAALDDLQLATGDRVAVLALNGAGHLVAWLAIPRSGRILVDLNTRLAPSELALILDDSAARVLLVDDAFVDAGRALAEQCDALKQLIYIGRGPTPADLLSIDELASGGARSPEDVAGDAIAGVFYTGGTTGLPKGAMLTHRNLVANAKHALLSLGYASDDVYLHAAPMFHLADGASTFALTWVGGRHVIMPSFEPTAWMRLVAQEQVTHALLVPTMIGMIVDHPEFATHDVSSLRRVFYGASPMPEEVLLRAMNAMPCGWGQAYGMTEAAPIVSFLTAEDHRRGRAGEQPFRTRLRSAGRPVVGVEVEVRGAHGDLVGAGECGEICVRGPNLMKGYWNRPQETDAVLDPDGWYHSGDAGYVDAGGYLFIVDRIKDMIISGGENVYSAEVENAIHQHPDVQLCAVFGVPDERWGERVHAAVVLRPARRSSRTTSSTTAGS